MPYTSFHSPGRPGYGGARTELLLVRHAEAWCNVDDVIGGPAGCRGLTPRGRAEAERLARRLAAIRAAGREIDWFVCSPRRRAIETAAILEPAVGHGAEPAEDWADQDFGEADGCARAMLSAGLVQAVQLSPGRPPAPGGESWNDYVARIARALSRPRPPISRSGPSEPPAPPRRGRGRSILVVTHGEAINAVHQVLWGLPPGWPGPLGMVVGTTGLCVWREEPLDPYRPEFGWEWRLVRHNDTSHLHEQPDASGWLACR